MRVTLLKKWRGGEKKIHNKEQHKKGKPQKRRKYLQTIDWEGLCFQSVWSPSSTEPLEDIFKWAKALNRCFRRFQWPNLSRRYWIRKTQIKTPARCYLPSTQWAITSGQVLYGVAENMEIMQVDGVDNRTATLENCLLVPQKFRMQLWCDLTGHC